MFEEFGINAGYVEEIHARWVQSPQSVEDGWRRLFEGTTPVSPGTPKGNGVAAHPTGHGNGAAAPAPSRTATSSAASYRESVRDTVIAATELQSRVAHLVNEYRVRGHLSADLDPLGSRPPIAPELELSNFGLTEGDVDKTFSTAGMSGFPERATLREIVAHLRETYCSSIGVEFTHVGEPEQRLWLQQQMESTGNHASLDRTELVRILTKLTEAEIFEQFIHKNYGGGARRFSLEGAESVIPMIDLLIESAGQHGIEELVIGMAHRGRLNVLVNVMGKNVREIFAAFDDKKPERFLGAGDVKYHLGYSSEVVTQSGRPIHLSMAFNPSHLEFVNPVVEGRVRAKIDRRKRKSTMPLLIHGDAAFMGQGVVAETLNLAQLEGYTTGGTIHLVVNNQIGFTTLPVDSRSTRYCTDVARMLRVPVFHVNGEDPEAVIQVTRLAIEFRQRFKQDVVIDMYCYRKYGHNEGDEPRFTQPRMYALIDKKPTVREVYVARLVKAGHVSREEADAIAQERRATLERALEEARQGDFHQMPEAMGGVWAPYRGGLDASVPEVSTAFSKETLCQALDKLATMPPGFHANPKALKILEQRRLRGLDGQPLDWGTAEHLAFAFHPIGRPWDSHQRARLATRNVLPSPRGPLRHRDRRAVYAARAFGRRNDRCRTVRDLRFAAQRGRGAGLRVRVLARSARQTRRLGGPVRRLRERRTSDRRPVHRVGRRQVVAPVGTRAAAAPRVRGPRPGALQCAHRAIFTALGGRQHPGLQPDHARAVLPRAEASSEPSFAQAARRLHSEVAFATSRGHQLARRARIRVIPARHCR